MVVISAKLIAASVFSPKQAEGLIEILVRKIRQLVWQKTTVFPKPERKVLEGEGNNKSRHYG